MKVPRKQSLGRMILDLKPGDQLVVMHSNNDATDFRRGNLRATTRAELALHRGKKIVRRRKDEADDPEMFPPTQRASRPVSNPISKYRGVHWHGRAGGWEAQRKIGKFRIYAGIHTTQELAYSALQKEVRKFTRRQRMDEVS